MGEGLREVAEVLAGGGVHLLAVQAERAAEREQFVEQRFGLAGAAGAGEGLDEPERAGQESAFAAGEAVGAWRVAVQQRATGAELTANGVDRADDRRLGAGSNSSSGRSTAASSEGEP